MDFIDNSFFPRNGSQAPFYSQRDSAWSSLPLGKSTVTISDQGCLLSCYAMALTKAGRSFTPATLNQHLTRTDSYIFNGYSIPPSAFEDMGLRYSTRVYATAPSFRSELTRALSTPHTIVMLELDDMIHWVLAVSISGESLIVNDPSANAPNTRLPLSSVESFTIHTY